MIIVFLFDYFDDYYWWFRFDDAFFHYDIAIFRFIVLLLWLIFVDAFRYAFVIDTLCFVMILLITFML